MDPDQLNKPHISQELAITLIRQLYGMKVITIKEMVSYDDKNFHVTVAPEHDNLYIKEISEDGYTLKVTNTVKSALPGHFDTMHAAMRHASSKGLRLPQPVVNMEGNTWALRNVPVKDKDDNILTGTCGIHMLTFLPGVPVSTIKYDKGILHQWGALLARFHNAMMDFPQDLRTSKDIFWSLAYVLRVEDFVDCLDEEKRELVLSVTRTLPEEMKKALPFLQTGCLHADFNENNLLVRKFNHGYEVDGILDLEDMHHGTYTWDIALMLAYVSLGCDDLDPIEGMGHALKGYLQIRSLNEMDMSFLKICIASRLCQSLVFGAYNYQRDPSNVYVLVSAKTGWSRLKLIWEMSNETLMEKWKNVD